MSFAVILALMIGMAAVAYTRLTRIDQLTSSIETDNLQGCTTATRLLSIWSPITR